MMNHYIVGSDSRSRKTLTYKPSTISQCVSGSLLFIDDDTPNSQRLQVHRLPSGEHLGSVSYNQLGFEEKDWVSEMGTCTGDILHLRVVNPTSDKRKLNTYQVELNELLILSNAK